ncbi:hypothetical protein GH714_000552 [Hevea brasiliensis]|uniref:F-box associated beta-propeller type 1 domain-containing protein n=1 Tax=Hevea brasiliensis TaxID=3981 RepID=A0A6A6KF06_HEVBR|nr:hypothetical protein GH714_000552 [Hevea brasiliensis]
MREGSTSAFLNGACHWVATKEDGISEVIVSFALGEEVFGEMEEPDCLVNKYIFMDIAVFDGSLLLVPFMKFTTERCFSVWMMKKYGVPGSWTKLFNISHLEWIRRRNLGYRNFGQYTLLLFGTLVESLVLLDEADEFAEEEASKDDGTNGVSKEPSSSPDGVDKDLQKISEGKKNANNPMILNEANEILGRAALWNPSVRKIIAIPGPNVTFTSHGPYIHSLGFGFDSTTDDFKLVSVVYLQDSDFNFHEIPPLVEIYSLRSRCWRMVHNDMRYAILECSTSAFLNGACNWLPLSDKRGLLEAM